MNNMEEPRLTLESYQKMAIFWLSLEANQDRWEALLTSEFGMWATMLGIEPRICTECFESIQRIQSSFEEVRTALRGISCPSPPCNLDLKDRQCQQMLEKVSSFAAPGEEL